MNHGNPGTISHGTLRTEDLLDRFADALEDLITRNAKLPLMRRQKLVTLVWLAREVKDYDSETAMDLVSELIDMLNDFAPPGHYFGAHMGDGADFGFWPDEETEAAE